MTSSRIRRHGGSHFLTSTEAGCGLLLGTIAIFALTPVFAGHLRLSDLEGPIWLAWILFGIVSILLIFALWLAMWSHWLSSAPRTPGGRKFWFVILLCFFFWGSVLYYYCVYLPWFLMRCARTSARYSTPAANFLPSRRFSEMISNGLRWRVY